MDTGSLDVTMLMIHGLIDHPMILEMERARIAELKHHKMVKELIERCLKNETIREALEIDEDLAELFIAAEVSERNRK